jgi:hypothetical protein
VLLFAAAANTPIVNSPSKQAAMAAGGGDNGAGEGEFYLRYYVGHKGKFGHEFLEFEFRPDGKLRYANNSNYKNDTMIRKEVFVSPSVLREARRIIQESEVTFASACWIRSDAFPLRSAARVRSRV